MNEPSPAAYIHELEMEATTILDHAGQAAQHYADGDPAAAALVLGLLHYKFSAAIGASDAALAQIRTVDGVGPDDALK